MKHLIWAVAASPLLIAATPVPPEPPHPPRAIVIDLDLAGGAVWTEAHDAVLSDAMDSLREALAALPGELDREQVRIRVQLAREAGQQARQAAHLARLHGERAHAIGLRAGARGMEAGLRAIDEALERGEVTRLGETRPMTAEERAELIETRARMEARVAQFREEHAVFLGDDAEGERRMVVLRRDGSDSADRRRVRVEDRNGRVRVWIDGEELEGDALTSWLNSGEGQRMTRQRAEPPLLGGE